MTKLIASAGTIEQLEKMINQYFYSTSYKIDGEQVTNTKTGKTLDGYKVTVKKPRYRFELEV